MKGSLRFFFVGLLALLATSVFSQMQHSTYLRALDDLRGARWMIDNRPGNWAQAQDEMAAVARIDDAIKEIQRLRIDDGRDNGYHPMFDVEENDRPGRLRHAEQLLKRAREDLRDAENEGEFRGLRDRTIQHIEGAIQFTENAMRASGVQAPAPVNTFGSRMQPGAVLNAGQSIFSADGRFQFIYQTDGNLVLYGGGMALWATMTNNGGVGICTMQTDGNLVVYAPGGQALWSTGTYGAPGSYLVVQNDGNVVIYSPDGKALWASNTGGR